jgi:hypothetical protein
MFLRDGSRMILPQFISASKSVYSKLQYVTWIEVGVDQRRPRVKDYLQISQNDMVVTVVCYVFLHEWYSTAQLLIQEASLPAVILSASPPFAASWLGSDSAPAPPASGRVV